MLRPFDFKHAFAVVVTGATWNPCGHMLLNTGGSGGWYFHVAERKGNPRFMRADGYRAYSTAKWPPIPRQSGHRFHGNLATDSTPIRPPIPRQNGHRFHGNPASLLWVGRKDMN
jgi:hypothetical protein